jgi:tetratricopeptide (TPR) repeat protein
MNYHEHFDSHARPRLRWLASTIFMVTLSLWIACNLSAWGGAASPANLPEIPAETNTPEIKTSDLGTSATNSAAEVADAATPAPAAADSADTNSPAQAPEPGMLPTPDVTAVVTNKPVDHAREFQIQLDLARQQRHEKNPSLAVSTLVSLLQTNASAELKRPALFELALAAQDDNQLLKAQQVFSQYLHNYPEDPSVPEVLLRQGLLYRQMGVTTLAISKFYAVMSTALKLKLNNIDYYKKLVLQAQVEIADTYYLEGKYLEASDFFGRLLRTEAPELNKTQVQFKLIRSLSSLTNEAETVAKAQVFLDLYPDCQEVPEVRFILASALKKLGHNPESMKQVLLLLQSQQENVRKNPEIWVYWQRRAGNEIANQLYKEGDYLNALEIYLSLADLDKSATWQLPVWYQTALVYEQLQQWHKATETYMRIINRQKELTAADTSPSLASLLEMAKWRKDYIDWMEKARATNQGYQRTAAYEPPSAPAK